MVNRNERDVWLVVYDVWSTTKPRKKQERVHSYGFFEQSCRKKNSIGFLPDAGEFPCEMRRA